MILPKKNEKKRKNETTLDCKWVATRLGERGMRVVGQNEKGMLVSDDDDNDECNADADDADDTNNLIFVIFCQ